MTPSKKTTPKKAARKGPCQREHFHRVGTYCKFCDTLIKKGPT